MYRTKFYRTLTLILFAFPFILTASLFSGSSNLEARVLTSFADVADRAVPGVVNIRTTSYIRGKEARLDPYQFFLHGRLPKTSSTHSLGSGVIINNKGHVLTNYHVVKDANVIDILFAKKKRKVRAKVVGVDTKTDLALLAVKLPKGVKAIDLGKVIRPWIGVVGKNILSTDEVGDDYDPTGVYGVIIANLIIDGPGHKAGLKMGDLIMGLNKSKVRDMNHLQRLLNQKSPAERVRLKIYRRGKGFINIAVNLSEIPKAQNIPKEKDLF